MSFKQIFLLLIISIIFNKMNSQSIIETICYTPIGVFHTDYFPGTATPRQGILVPEGKARIEIYPQYHSALSSLGFFEYIIVLFHFDKVESWEPRVNPPESNHEHNFGLFSTRSPRRPNPIGFSIIKLEKIKDGILYVSGIDAFDGTPVLDIKPYLPSVDCVKSIRNELIEKELGHHDENFINDPIYYK